MTWVLKREFKENSKSLEYTQGESEGVADRVSKSKS